MAFSRRLALQAAEKLVSRGRLPAAVKQYRKALADRPDDTGTLNRLGDLYARLDRVDEAVEMFTSAADHFATEGFFVKAIAIYKKIIRLDPTRIAVYETLADLYHRQGLLNEARAQYQVVADYYKQSGNQAALASVFEKLVELDPDNPTHRLKLAEFYCNSNRIPEAMEQYQKIAAFMLEHGKIEEAYKVYVGAYELKIDDLGFLTDIIVQLTDAGQDELAQRLLAHAIERNPDAARVAELVDLPIPDLAERRGSQLPSTEPEVEEGGPASAELVAGDTVEVESADLTVDVEPQVAKTFEEDGEEAMAQAGEETAEEVEVVELADLVELELAVSESTLLSEESAVEATDETGEFEIDLDGLESLAADEAPGVEAEPDSDSAARAEELVTEANVLSNYGLDTKAVELLEQALELAPQNIEAGQLLLHMHREADRPDAVREVAANFLVGDSLPEELAGLLDDWGFQLDAGHIEAPESESEGPAAVPVEPETPRVDEARLTWLDEEAAPSPGADPDNLFGEEDDFFDLAAELEEELRAEEKELLGEVPQVEEQSIEEIVEGFKQGVAETLSAEDYDTHYNLGIAYREMGLVDEAVGEFQLAAKSSRYLVDCCSLLGACFLEKGFPDLAVKWYERGLKAEAVSDEEKLGLLYELGNLYLTTGDRDTAKDTFAEIYGANSNYRDVVAKLEELR